MTRSLTTDLLALGSLPRELPPAFSMNAFATAMSADRSNLPALETRESRHFTANHCLHDVPRAGGGRRTLGVPNPFSQLLLAEQVTADWDALAQHLEGGERPFFSATRPKWWRSRARALIPRYRIRDRWKLRLRTRAGARYLLFTDIAQFYPSIYTHSIPWALSGKEKSKENRFDASFLGNELDRRARNAQDQQTIGIPIGPDTSLLIAELIMKTVDDDLRRQLPGARGFRFIDDFELSFSSLRDAERARSIIAGSLRHMELRLNENKTRICELPDAVDGTWVVDVSSALPSSEKLSEKELHRFSTVLLDHAIRSPDDAVMKYGLMLLRGHTPSNTRSTVTMIRLALNALSSDSLAIANAIALLIQLEARESGIVGRPRLREVLELSLTHHVDRMRSHEVSWLLWAALAFDVSLTVPSGLAGLEDDFVALLALHGEQRALWTLTDKSTWADWMSAHELQGRHWLVAYEASVRGWLPGTPTHSGHPHFQFLADHGVRFYDDRAVDFAIELEAAAPLPGGTMGDFYP